MKKDWRVWAFMAVPLVLGAISLALVANLMLAAAHYLNTH